MKISVNGVELNYEVIGSGDPLIMVHGNSEDHTIFTEAAEVLKDYYTCYLVDTRSHGKSSKVKRLHYRDMAQDYIEFIKALNLQNVTYFGFSDGGILGLLIMLALTLVHAEYLLTPENLLLYELVWMIPGLLITEWTRVI